MTEIAMVFEVLGDGKWHSLGELQQKLNLSEREVQAIIKFLKKYDFVKFDKAHEKVKN